MGRILIIILYITYLYLFRYFSFEPIVYPLFMHHFLQTNTDKNLNSSLLS